MYVNYTIIVSVTCFDTLYYYYNVYQFYYYYYYY